MKSSVGADEPVRTAALSRAEAQVAEITRDPTAYVIKVRQQRREQGRAGGWFRVAHRGTAGRTKGHTRTAG